MGDELPPSNTFGHAFQGANGLQASVTWAESQNGCQPKAPLPLRDYCRDSFRYIIYACDDRNRAESYGGAFIDNDQYGCVRWWLGADSSAMPRARLAMNAINTTVEESEKLKPAQQAMLVKVLDQLEPELPKLKREKVEQFRRGHL